MKTELSFPGGVRGLPSSEAQRGPTAPVEPSTGDPWAGVKQVLRWKRGSVQALLLAGVTVLVGVALALLAGVLLAP